MARKISKANINMNKLQGFIYVFQRVLYKVREGLFRTMDKRTASVQENYDFFPK